MNIKPQKGMQEYLPEAAAQRDRLMSLILDTYTKCGFTRIYTPAIESAENLDKSDGGDNLNLIFKILKRGEKLEAVRGIEIGNIFKLGTKSKAWMRGRSNGWRLSRVVREVDMYE